MKERQNVAWQNEIEKSKWLCRRERQREAKRTRKRKRKRERGL